MADEKIIEDMEDTEAQDEEFSPDSHSRARNRTVMLTPDITGQVRAMLAQEMNKGFTITSNEKESGSSVFSTYAPAGEKRGDSGSFTRPQAAQPAAEKQAPPIAVAPVEHTSGYAHAAQLTPIIGFLVSYDSNINGEVFELRSGRWIVSCEKSTSGNYILLNDDSISPLHAIMRVSPSGEIQVLDQLSEHGTGITRFGSKDEELLTGIMSSVEHGDVLRFGTRKFHVCLVAVNSD